MGWNAHQIWRVWKPREGERFPFFINKSKRIFDNWEHSCTVIESIPRSYLGGLFQGMPPVAEVMKGALTLVLREKSERPCLGVLFARKTSSFPGLEETGLTKGGNLGVHRDDGQSDWSIVTEAICERWKENRWDSGGLVVVSRKTPIDVAPFRESVDPDDGLGACLARFGDWEAIVHVDTLGAIAFSRHPDFSTILEESYPPPP